jgi:hypothetical protein
MVQASLADLCESVTLHRTKSFSLFDADERTEFFRHIIAVVRFISSGMANVGFLRRDVADNPIHREGAQISKKDNSGDVDDEEAEEGLHGPPQQVLDLDELNVWFATESWRYER